ncbi:hypothetical protein HKCCE3408_11290 [Rhodobacterales bacterium HKCCE3408]|nr:hypothetical protein [Rhodobacterales bacterium HKCCE3408]
MMNFLQASIIAVFAVGAGAATISVMKEDPAGFVVPQGPWQPGEDLDGRSFQVEGTILETEETLPDQLNFEDGRFQSAMCQLYCDFGWSDYRTWTDGDMIHFTATTRCPDAPHSVVWFGTVSGGTMRVERRWTTRRWYWTRHLNFIGEGSMTPPEATG